VFEREGALWRDGVPHRLLVRKSVQYVDGQDSYAVDYRIVNREHKPLEVWFGVEFAVGAMAGDAPDRFFDIEGRPLQDRRLRSAGEEENVRSFKLVDRWLRLQTTFNVDRPASLWRFPLETVSLSESGFERVYQASVVVPHWRFHLGPAGDGPSDDQEFHVRISQAVTPA
jgi:hypothetical protein